MTRSTILYNLIYPSAKTGSVTLDSIEVRLLTSDVGIIDAEVTFVQKANDQEIIGQTW